MWSQIVLCLLVGLAYASTNPGWKDNAEYVYQVRGRTLASLHEVSDQYSGIVFKANLRIQPRNDGLLQGIISDAKYSQVHSQLWDGWNTYIPDAELSWKPLEMSYKPFQVETKNGVITDLIVNKDISNWEANIIKSIMSQFQLNTNVNHSNEEISHSANSVAFSTMEDTVTGNTETLYKINPLPEYLLQENLWGQKVLELKGDGEVLEVVKHRNYSNSVELPSYFYGFGGLEHGYPATNEMGKFFVRDSVSRAILTGSLNRYVIQNSYTVSEVLVSPTLSDKQKGSVYSFMNVTLEGVKSQDQKIQEISNPLRLGNLVYTYEYPSIHSSDVREKKPYQLRHKYAMIGERYQRATNMLRMRRSLDHDNAQDEFDSSNSEESYKQRNTQIHEAPDSPLLPYTMGYKGMSIKQAVDVVKTVVQLAQEIGEDLQNPEKIPHEGTLNKFTTLASLLKVMSLQEIQRAASELYNTDEQGSKRDAWQAFRDSVAEAGTGPALMIIQDWIQSKKLTKPEASLVISVMSKSVRQPTEQYFKSFFELVKSQEVQSEWPLNDTALLSFAQFVRIAGVDQEEARKQYPVKSFVGLVSEETQKFIKETIIPFYSKQLDEAISRAETHKIHVYIRALGNIAHPQILSAFESYMEGKKQASQYQRLLMVIAMDRLAEVYPEEARSVLFKIYQNTGESQEIRSAAVFQLMRTQPRPEMLQVMASYTNMDKHEHVNAAVKSAIETAAELEGPQYYPLRLSAEAAKPLLTRKIYGIQYGAFYLRNRFIEELNLRHKEFVEIIGNEDSFYPKGFKYSLRHFLGGKTMKLVNVQSLVSDMDELIHVLKKKTAEYLEQQEQQKQSFGQQKEHQWSSQKIASLLKMRAEELEQLEASLYAEYGSLLGMISFDNGTIERLPEVIKKYEQELKNGKKFNLVKMTNEREMAISFPTDMGLPFLFTYDTPMMMKLEGSVKGFAQPQISQEGKLHTPETLQLRSDFAFTVTSKLQSRISFITPFDYQQYIAGFDKYMQLHVPVYGNLEVNNKLKQTKIEIEPQQAKSRNLFNYSTWPYTSRIDITNFQPVSSQPNTHYVKQDNLHGYDMTLGKKETGLPVRVQIQHQRRFVDYAFLRENFVKHGMFAGLMALWEDSDIQHSQINLSYLPEESSTRRVVIHVGHQMAYKSNPESDNSDLEFSFSEDPQERKKSIIDKASAGIKNVEARAYDVAFEFQGDKNIKYTLTGALGKSNVDPKSRVIIFFKRIADNQDNKEFELIFKADNEVPNTNALDLEYSLQAEPIIKSKIQLAFGSGSLERASKVKGQFEFSRSEQRKQYLREQPMFKECQFEMGKGDNQLPACVNMTMEANLLDRVNLKLQYQKLAPELEELFKTLYYSARFQFMPSVETDRQQTAGSDEMEIQALFDPDLKFVNVTVKTPQEQTTINSIKVNDYAKEIFVLHPVFHLRSRLISKALELNSYRPFATVDQTRVSTFNNYTYPADISKHWTVVFQYIPREARHGGQQESIEQRLKHQTEHYVVLVRESSVDSQKKDVKITFSSPKTEYRVVDITMTPKQGSFKAKVTFDDQEVQINDKQSYDYNNGYIQIYGLPNGEVKVEVRDGFYVIYDGKRVRLTTGESKFRNSVRGIAGPFNDERVEDLLTPVNCIARDSQKFIRSFEIEGQEGEQVRQQFLDNNRECLERRIPLYVDVISDFDAARDETWQHHSSGKCTHFQTRYIEQNGEICFTLRAMPVCSSSCRPKVTITKNVPVHCIQKTNVSQFWKNQIDKGASPDFSHKKESRVLSMQLPQSCSQ